MLDQNPARALNAKNRSPRKSSNMSKLTQFFTKKRAIIFAGVFFVLDRILKYLAISSTVSPSVWEVGGINLMPNIFNFSLFLNQGFIFSIPTKNFIFWLATLPIYFIILLLLIKNFRKNTNLVPALMFIFLGATSNLLDRILYGGTVDYLIFFRTSAVNLADAMIIFGLVLVWSQPNPKVSL